MIADDFRAWKQTKSDDLMKWMVLIISIACIVPLSGWIRDNPRHHAKIWTLIGLLPFLIDPLHLYMAVVSWAEWPGYAKGIELTSLDLILIAIYFSLPPSRVRLPFTWAMGLYFATVLLSALQAGVTTPVFFYVWQLIRMFFVFAVVARASSSKLVVESLLRGMAIGICMEAVFVVLQRFVFGEIQAVGTAGHQNSLGLMCHFAIFPFCAWLLAGHRGWAPRAVPLLGLLIAVLTVSRATLALAVAGYAALFIASACRSWTSKKAILGFSGLLLLVALSPLVLLSMEDRFTATPETTYDERAAFQIASTAILSDHPMGVGANNYVVVANTQGYNVAAGVAETTGSLSANVHNVYLLVAAETGYLGLISFIILLLCPLAFALRNGWQKLNDDRTDLLLGFAVAFTVVYIHSFFEWIFITFTAQYFFAIDIGLVVGLATQLNREAKPLLRKTPSLSRTTSIVVPSVVRSNSGLKEQSVGKTL